MQRPSDSRRAGFTMVELLVVILIIVVLIGLLIPTVSRVRQSGYAADSAQRINNVRNAIERYYGDFQAYPGIFSNAQISGGVTLSGKKLNGDNVPNLRISMTENMVLSLLGGLRADNIIYAADFGRGALGFNPANPKRYAAYVDKASIGLADDLQEGGWAATVPINPDRQRQNQSPRVRPDPTDSAIPEPMDAFPEPMPILYVRARVGATANGIGSADDNAAQYNVSHWRTYGFGTGDTDLYTLDTAADKAYPGSPGSFPNGWNDYLLNRSTGAVHQKDSYILIGAGPDRKYGTADDQTNFGKVK